MSLNLRMLLAPVTLILVIFAIGIIGYSSLSSTTAQYNRLAAESIPNIGMSDEMFLHFRQIRISVRTLGIKGISKTQEDAAIKETLASIAAYEKVADAYEKIEFAPGEDELYKKVNEAWKAFKITGGKILDYQAQGTPEAKEKMLDIFFNECPEKAEVYRLAIAALVDFHRKNAAEWTASAQNAASAAKQWIMLAVGLGLVLGMGLALFTIKSVSSLIGAISKVVNSLTENAEIVSTISASISEASEKLSASSTEQAAAIQETTSAIEQTSQMVQKNADNADRSASASKSSHEDAENGKRSVEEMIQSIELISRSNSEVMSQFENGNKEMTSIVALINEIGDKTKVINDIVFQTKLLSFNASVEAARAGEHGKGFAVVAEEVGNLAAMSGRSAKEITDLLEKSTKRVQDIVASSKGRVESLMKESSERVEAGNRTAKVCGDALAEIVAKVGSVNGLVGEIATASQEQSKGISEINKAIAQLDMAAQENAATSQTAATSANQLSEQVVNLHSAIESLNHLVNGRREARQAGFQAPRTNEASMPKPNKLAA